MKRWLLCGMAAVLAMLAGQALALSSIAGRVTNAGGAGIAGVRVDLWRDEGGWWGNVGLTTTDASGNYQLLNLAAKTYRVSFTDPNGNYVAEYYDNAAGSSSATSLVLGVNETRSGISAVLAPASRITGKVTALDGVTTISGVTVWAYAYNGSWWDRVSTGTTDAAGRYTVGGLAANTYRVGFEDDNGNYVAEYYNDSDSIDTAQGVTVGTSVTIPDINAALAPGSRISGLVKGPDGSPLRDVNVGLQRWTGSWWQGFYEASGRSTGSDGTYTLGGVPTGVYRVSFSVWGGTYATEWYNDKPFEELANGVNVPPTTTVPGINATLGLAGRITGKVTGPDGTTAVNGVMVEVHYKSGSALVQLYQSTAFTGSDGTYSIGSLPAASYCLRFTDGTGAYAAEWFNNAADGASATAIAVTAGATASGKDVSLGTGAKIRGSLTGPNGTTPLANITVVAERQSGTTWVWSGSGFSDDTGAYTVGGLAAGVYRVEFIHGHGDVYASEWYNDKPDGASANSFTVAAGATVTGIDASLASGARLSGTVRQPNGTTPAAGIDVTAFRRSGADWLEETSATTAADGTYAFAGLKPGTYRLRFMDTAAGVYATEWHNNAVRRETATDIALAAAANVSGIDATLGNGGAIAGRVLGPDLSSPLAYITVQVHAFYGTDWSLVGEVLTGADGRYRVGGLRTGNYRVAFIAGSGFHLQEWYNDRPDVTSAEDVAVVEGTTTDNINCALGEAMVKASIAGTVTRAGGTTRLGGIRVTLDQRDAEGVWSTVASTWTGFEGTYWLPNLDAGTYRVGFADPLGMYVAEWYDNEATAGAATVLTVEDGQKVQGVDAVLAINATVKASLAGLVTGPNGTTPLGGIQVDVERLEGGAWLPAATVWTAPSGRYQVRDLSAGTNRIQFSDLTGVYTNEWYNNAATADAAQRVVANPGDFLVDLNASLQLASPDGIIFEDYFYDPPANTMLQSHWTIRVVNQTNREPLAVMEYYRNGNTKQGGRFRDDAHRHGLCSYWYEDGRLQTRGLFANDQPDGEWTTLHSNAVIAVRGVYVMGKEEGVWIWRYTNSVLQETCQYLHGLRHGSNRFWRVDGTPRLEFTYVSDELNGPSRNWYTNGVLASAGNLNVHGPDGVWRFWHDNGLLSSLVEFRDGAELNSHVYSYQYGTGGTLGVSEDRYYTVRDGFDYLQKKTEYHRDGELKAVWTYVDDVLQGQQVGYHVNGLKEWAMRYEDGVKWGLDAKWFDSGQVYQIQYWVDGTLTGPCARWNMDGSVSFTGTYNGNGRLHGVVHSWYEERKWSGISWGITSQVYVAMTVVDGTAFGPYERRDVYSEEGWSQYGRWTYMKGRVEVYVPEHYTAGEPHPGTVGTWLYQKCLENGTVTSARVNWGPGLGGPPPYREVPPGEREVQGTVQDGKRGGLLADVTITVGNETTTTGGFGKYGVRLGSSHSFALPFTVKASKPGYFSSEETVNLKSMAVGYAHFKLMPIEPLGTPVITKVISQRGDVFIGGVPLPNIYTVRVEWNGANPNKLIIEKNRLVSEVIPDTKGGVFAFDMGSDFTPSLDPNLNTILVTAVTTAGKKSEPYRLNPVVMPKPLWMIQNDWALRLMALTKDPGATYAFGLKVPNPAWKFDVSDWLPASAKNALKNLPVVGGDYKVLETQFSFNAEYKTDGSSKLALSGEAGFIAGGKGIMGQAKGTGGVEFVPGEGLCWTGTEIYVNLQGVVESELTPIQLCPPLAAAATLPFVGEVLVRWSGAVEVKSVVTFGFGATAEFNSRKNPSPPWFVSFKPEILGSGSLVFSAKPIVGLEAEVSATAAAKLVFVMFPWSDLGVDRGECELSAKAAFVIRGYRTEFEGRQVFAFPSPTNSTESLALALDGGLVGSEALAMPPPLATFAPIPRDFLKHGPYSRFAARDPRRVALAAAPGAVEDRVIENVYPYAQPSIAVQNGQTAIAAVFFDAADPTLQATDIGVVMHDGTTYAAPVLAINDTRAEFAPTVAFDVAGRVVCAWERVKDPAFEGTNLTEMVPELEIVTASFDPGSARWSAPVALTDNACLDQAPVLQRGFDGSLFLAWQSNPANELMGTTNAPSALHYALWDAGAGAFGPVETLPNRLTNAATVRVAYDGTEARIVYMQDMDGDLATADDGELFGQTLAGGVWSAPERLTDNTVPDNAPNLLYRAAGAPELLWQQNSNVVRMADWPTLTAAVVRTNSASFTFGDAQFVAAPAGRLAMVWQDCDGVNPDLYYSIYDTDLNAWSLDRRLTQDVELEKGTVAAFASDGQLNLAYIKKNMTNEFTDLYHTMHTLHYDLAVEGGAVSVEPALPAPGQAVLLRCRVRNAGDLALAGAVASFYTGDPALGGGFIGNALVTQAVFRAGDAAVAELAWTVPPDGSVRSVFVILDVDGLVPERDEVNNTGEYVFLRPDLEARSLRVEDLGDGQVELIARIYNNGTAEARDVPVLFRGDGQVLETNLVANIPTGMCVEVTCTTWAEWSFTNLPGLAEVVVDDERVLAESNEDNNVASVRVRLGSDQDGDGMDDQWERFHFHALYPTGTDDTDGDGAPDKREYESQTNPRLAESVLACTIGPPDAEGAVTLTWSATPGVTYQPQWRDDLLGAEWGNLGATVTAVASTATATDRPPVGNTTRYYRILVVTPARPR